MTDNLPPEKRSWNMSRVHSKDTSVEVKVRRYLFSKVFGIERMFPLFQESRILFCRSIVPLYSYTAAFGIDIKTASAQQLLKRIWIIGCRNFSVILKMTPKIMKSLNKLGGSRLLFGNVKSTKILKTRCKNLLKR